MSHILFDFLTKCCYTGWTQMGFGIIPANQAEAFTQTLLGQRSDFVAVGDGNRIGTFSFIGNDLADQAAAVRAVAH